MQLSPNFAKTSDPYENLANAIIIQSVLDFTKAFCRFQTQQSDTDALTIRQIKVFFFSDWFHTLTNADPKMLMRRTEELANKRLKERNKRIKSKKVNK